MPPLLCRIPVDPDGASVRQDYPVRTLKAFAQRSEVWAHIYSAQQAQRTASYLRRSLACSCTSVADQYIIHVETVVRSFMRSWSVFYRSLFGVEVRIHLTSRPTSVYFLDRIRMHTVQPTGRDLRWWHHSGVRHRHELDHAAGARAGIVPRDHFAAICGVTVADDQCGKPSPE